MRVTYFDDTDPFWFILMAIKLWKLKTLTKILLLNWTKMETSFQ